MKADIYILDDYISLDDIREIVADTLTNQVNSTEYHESDLFDLLTEEIDYAETIDHQTCRIRRIGSY